MATIGSITIAFDTDISRLVSGIEDAVSEVESLKEEINSAGGEVLLRVSVDSRSAASQIAKLKTAADSVSEVSSAVRVKVDGVADVDRLISSISGVDNKSVRLAVEASGLSSVDELRAALAGVQSKSVTAAVEASGLGSVDELRSALDGVESKSVIAAVEASGLGSVDELKSALDGINSKSVTAAVEASGLGSVDELRSALDGVQSKSVTAAVEASGLSSVDDLRSALDGINSKSVTAAVEASGLGSVDELKAALAGIQSKSVTAAVEASGLGSVDELKSALEGIDSKSVTAAVEASGLGSVDELRSALDGINSKSVTAAVAASGLGDVESLRQAIDAVQGKSVSVDAKVGGADELASLPDLLKPISDIDLTAKFASLSSEIEDTIDLFDDLSDKLESLAEELDSFTATKVNIKPTVDTTDVAKAIDEAASLADAAKPVVKVTSDKTAVEGVKDAVDGIPKEVTLKSSAKEVVKAAADAAKEVKPLKSGFYIPIKVAYGSLVEARKAVTGLDVAYRVAAKSLLGFNGTASSSVITAANITRAWTSAASAYEASTSSAVLLDKSLRTVAKSGADQKQLSAATVEGGSAFVGAAAGATLHAAATQAVARATKEFNEPLRESTRFLAEIGIGYAQAALAAKVAEGSAKLLKTAIESEVNPLAAVSAFSKTYARGLDNLAISAVAATDRQRVLVRTTALLEEVSASLRSTGESVVAPFVTGYTRARAAGDGYFAAISRGLKGQANSIGPVRKSLETLSNALEPFTTGFSRAREAGGTFFAAFDRGITAQLQSIDIFRGAVEAIGSAFKVTGLSSFFEPLITGFTRARTAGLGYIAATARGVSGQLNSLAAYRALSQAIQSFGDLLVRTGGYFIGVNASTKAGRIAFDLFRASVTAMRSTLAEAAGYFGVLRTAASAAISALPGGTTVVKAFADGWRELSGIALKVSTNTQYITGAIKLAATAFTVAAVAGGKFAHELAHMGAEAQSTRNLAERFGATTQEIEKLKYAADSAGVGIGQLAKGQQNLFTSLSKIRIGQINTDNVREAKLAFDRLGIGMEELKEKSPQEVFEDIAKKITAIKDPADRTAIAFDLFGKQGAAILPALKSLGQIEKDVERLDVTTSSLDFSRIEEMNNSFSRLKRATASYGEASLASYTELQAGFNNFKADVIGGLASLVQNSGSLYADFTKPLAVVLEVFGRIINIILRTAAVVVKLVSAFSPFPTVARFAQALGEKLKELLEPVEELVGEVDALVQAFYAAMTPDYWTGATEGGKSLTKQLVQTTQALGVMILSAGVAQAAMTGLGYKPGAALLRLLGSITITKAGLLSFARTAVSATLAGLRLLVVGIYQASVNFVAAGTRIAATAIATGAKTVGAWIIPSISAMASYVTGVNATAIASRLAAVNIAASWVIATAGLALIGVALVAVYENFDNLKSYFSNFTSNVTKLFTFEGAADAAKTVAGAIWNAFKSVLAGVGGFVGNIIQRISAAFANIKPPEAIKAAKASAEDIARQREKIAQTKFETQKAVQVNFGMVKGEEPVMPKPEDTNSLVKSITDARNEMDSLMIESVKFGENGGKAAEETASQFDKLQQQLADGLIDPKQFEEQSVKLSKTLRENLKFFSEDNASVARQKNRDFFKSLNDLVKQSAKDLREIQSGTVVEGRFFPTTEAIKAESNRVQAAYEAELKAIQKKRQKGGFGSGEAGEQNAAIAVEEAQRKQKRALENIGRDTSFADDIRKSLDDAFLSPVAAFEKRLKKIAENKSLSAIEKGQASALERNQFVEQNFGKTQAETFSERKSALNRASTPDRTGFRLISAEREEVERRKLRADRRSAAGIDNSPAEQLQLGLDKINDVFDVTGKSMAEIKKKLSPNDFVKYQEAVRNNANAVKESVGIQKPSIVKLQEAQDKLADAVGENTISYEEAGSAARKLRDDFMSSIGVSKTPFEEFSGAIDNIAEQFDAAGKPLDAVREKLKGNAEKLGLFDRAVKAARDNLLASLGIEKTPQQVFEEQMKKIDEAVNSTDKEKKITPEQATQARINATRKRDEALGGESANDFGSRIAEQRKKIEEAYGATGENDPKKLKDAMKELDKQKKQVARDYGAKGQKDPEKFRAATAEIEFKRKQINEDFGGAQKDPEKFKSAMRKLNESVPGAEPQSPVDKFKEDLEKLKYTFKEGTPEFNQGKKNLQAQLQEDLKPALDSTKADRRGIEGSDARSKGGVDTFFRILRGNDNPSLKAQLDVARNTKILADAAKNKDAAPVIAQLAAK